jgi:amino acid adenylation domain-containing protein
MSSQTQGFRLSPQQRRIWVSQPDGAALRCQCAVLLEGGLEIDALRGALDGVVAAHEILRTSFVRAPGMKLPVQVVGESGAYAWRHEDLSARAGEPLDALADELLRQERGEPFDAAHGPCLRAASFTLSTERHMLLLTLPALCADARTLHNLVRAVGDAYAASTASSASAASTANDDARAEVVQYVELAEWQNELLEDEQAAGRRFRQMQGGAEASAPTLPGENRVGGAKGSTPAPVNVFTPASVAVKVSPEVGAKLERAAGRPGSSHAAFLLACWSAFLFRLSGSRQFVVGTVFDGRKFEEMRDALGPLAKRLPVGVRVEPDARLADVARAVGRELADAEDRQEYFDWGAREETGGALADATARAVGFAFEERPARVSASGVNFSIVRQSVCFDPCRIELLCARRDDNLAVELFYDANAFDAAHARLLATQFATLLASAGERPEATVAELNLLSAGERKRLLVEWNATRADYASGSSVHRLFEEQAARTPDADAIVAGDARLSYAALNGRANRLARHLQKLGVGPEVPVGLFVERTPEMVVALLAVLKAGGAYVPLDPSYPPQRLSFMLEDARIRFVVSQEKLADALPPHGARVVRLDTDAEAFADESAENVAAEVSGENLAYIIYTSGSTGQPKGAAIPHRGLVNYLDWCRRAYDVEGGEGAPVHSPLGFDLTVTSLFAPLLSGRRVVLVPEESGVEGLGEALRASGGFSLVKITPPHLEVLNYLLPAAEAAGRTGALVIGGEALKAEALGFWRKHAPETRLINEYGPTETVVGCCVYEVAPGELLGGIVPIGRPIANTRLYVLDARFEPVATGVAGELYIGGDGLARGYLNRPDLTAERFLPDPFGVEAGARIYRSGDLARYAPDGNLEFLGRVDQQVKVRGFRIELGEIEAALSAHAGVREAAVIVREDTPDEKRLTAYVVAESGDATTAADLRAHLAERLPEYMIPMAFVMLERLPLTTNGKVDRRRLPEPDHARPELERAFVAPRNETEEALAKIWAEVLGVERVGVNDNFFELGGHSLLATQVVSRVRNTLKVDLPLRSLFFEAPTVALLAQMVEQRRAGGEHVEPTEIKALPRAEEADLEQMLSRIDQLSDEEVAALLQNKRLGRGV